jgi:hypothetical protein
MGDLARACAVARSEAVTGGARKTLDRRWGGRAAGTRLRRGADSAGRRIAVCGQSRTAGSRHCWSDRAGRARSGCDGRRSRSAIVRRQAGRCQCAARRRTAPRQCCSRLSGPTRSADRHLGRQQLPDRPAALWLAVSEHPSGRLCGGRGAAAQRGRLRRFGDLGRSAVGQASCRGSLCGGLRCATMAARSWRLLDAPREDWLPPGRTGHGTDGHLARLISPRI